MRILVTAGNTLVHIDRVRCITNIFTGRTGAAIARHAHACGHDVTLCTSHPDVAAPGAQPPGSWRVLPYRTFEELRGILEHELQTAPPDAVVHCAAVSDYLAAGVFAPAPGTSFADGTGQWRASSGPPVLVDRSAVKVKSDEPEIWLRLRQAPKLIDLFRTAWGFGGVLVKFKLEVGVDDAALLEVADASRRHSRADLMVANTLEGAAAWAFLGPLAQGYERVPRLELPARLLAAVESLTGEQRHG